MTSNAAATLLDIKEFIQKTRIPFSRWYAGIASDADARLFTDHKVDKAKDIWLHRRLSTDSEARDVEDALLKLGCHGGPGGGDGTTNKVYAYVITAYTSET